MEFLLVMELVNEKLRKNWKGFSGLYRAGIGSFFWNDELLKSNNCKLYLEFDFELYSYLFYFFIFYQHFFWLSDFF